MENARVKLIKNLWSGLCVAFSLYSKLPTPKTEWNRDTMKYAMSFLPLVGLLVGLLEWGWLALAQRYALEPLFYGAVAALLPFFITGGIHMDGFTDTADALCSYGDREKRLEILKDPHVGAFGVMYVAALLVLQLGLYAQLFAATALAPVLAVSFAFARTVGGGAIVWLPCAKNSGLAHTFAEGSDKRPVRAALLIEGLACLVWIADVSLPCALGLCVLTAVLAPLYRRFCLRVFGGVTGDLAGFAITLTETLLLAVCVLGGLLMRG